VNESAEIEARLRQAPDLPEILAASFDAFEVVRLLARRSQDRVAGLFAAFMCTADAAVDGREAVTIAPSLPAPGPAASVAAALAREPVASADLDAVIETLAALGALLEDRLTRAAATAGDPEDCTSCQDGAAAARRICRLMGRGDDDSRLW
jgi:hypothetical protein